MKKIIKRKVKYILLLYTAVQLLNASCTEKHYPVQADQILNDPSEQKNLQGFMAGGIEKELSIRNVSADELIKTARKYLGVPHCMGGASLSCMDCSGLLVRVFADHGVRLPHNSEEQARYGQIISEKATLKKGDLVFFIRSYQTDRFITHSGIYLGNNEFIHASSAKGVSITSLDNSWWKEKFIFGTRILN
jgi:murein DD-endopeptidase / murein LD-carboxypeptidase